MAQSVGDKIYKKVLKAKHGTIYFADSFLAFGTSKAVNKALERLVEKKEIIRVATGLYTRPKQSKLLGPLTPGVEEIAEAIRKRDKARIVPTGSYAQNALGLSTQVPMNVVYLTDGAARKVKAGNYIIKFKKTTPKNLSARGKISVLVIQALKSIGKDNVTEEEEAIVIEHLKKEKQSHLAHDIRLAPEWIRKIMRKALKR